MSPGDPPTAGDLGDLESAVAATGTAGPVSAPPRPPGRGGEGGTHSVGTGSVEQTTASVIVRGTLYGMSVWFQRKPL